MQITITQSQKPALTQQMQHSLSILEMSAAQLDAFLQEQAMENPFIEYEGNRLSSSAPASGSTRGSASALLDADSYLNLTNERHRAVTLKEHVLNQLSGMRLSAGQRAIISYLVENLDERGYLDLSAEDIMHQFHIESVTVRGALRLLHSLDPAGLGARSLSECLFLQLRRLPNRSLVAEQIVRSHLPDLAQGNYRKIASSLNVSEDDVLQARKLIRSLNPKPGNGFAPSEDIAYSPPDLLVQPDETGSLTISINPEICMDFHLNRDYISAIRSHEITPEVETYIREKILAADWIKSGIQRREKTLLICGRAILERQIGFFSRKDSSPQPYTMRELAEALSLNPSTITRALKDKSLRCPGGTYALSYFFVRTSTMENNESISAASIKRKITALIESEDRNAPFSDQELVDKLKLSCISLSRRAVANYRNDMFIPCSYARKH